MEQRNEKMVLLKLGRNNSRQQREGAIHLNDDELRELARFVVSLKINKMWTEKMLLELFKRKPELAESWKVTFDKMKDEMKEEVQFT